MNLPTDIANQSLDAAGVDFTLGDLEEGTRPAQVILRAYGQCLRQLLRACHWDFARKTAPLTLLADRTGQTANVGALVIDPRFRFEYAYPTDCAKVRFIPWNLEPQGSGVPSGNIQIPSTPLTSVQNQQPNCGRIVPARFTIASDANYPEPPGQITWQVQGVSPQGRTVVLTNVQNALCVYTAIMLYPSVWDPLFRAAFVAYLASEIAMPLAKDKKFGLQMRSEQMRIAKEKINQARITDGNEGSYSSDIPVDWMAFRNTGGARYGGSFNDGPGVLGYGFDACCFADGSAY